MGLGYAGGQPQVAWKRHSNPKARASFSELRPILSPFFVLSPGWLRRRKGPLGSQVSRQLGRGGMQRGGGLAWRGGMGRSSAGGGEGQAGPGAGLVRGPASPWPEALSLPPQPWPEVTFQLGPSMTCGQEGGRRAVQKKPVFTKHLLHAKPLASSFFSLMPGPRTLAARQLQALGPECSVLSALSSSSGLSCCDGQARWYKDKSINGFL